MGTRASLAHGVSDDLELRGPASGILFSGLVHLALASLLLVLSLNRIGINTAPPASPLFLGFLGPEHFAPNLEVPQANAIRFHIYQRGQMGRERAAPARVTMADPKPAAKKPLPSRERTQPSRDGALPASEHERSAARASNENGTAADATDEIAAIAALEPDIALSEHFAVTHMVKPVYPAFELERGVRARVLVTIQVSRDGRVEDARVTGAQTSPPGPTAAFELAAVEALRQWRFVLPHTPEYAGGTIATVPVEYEPADARFEQLGREIVH